MTKKRTLKKIVSLVLAIIIVVVSINMYSFDSSAASKKKSKLQITEDTYPETLRKGAEFKCTGLIESNYKLTKISIKIYAYEEDQKVRIYSKVYKPNAKTFDLSEIEEPFDFSALDVGTYYYTLYAKDASGKSKYFAKQQFMVILTQEKILKFSKKKIAKDGPQNPYTEFCSVHALAYANTIIDKKYHNYMDYWAPGAGAVWSRGGFTPKFFTKKTDALYAIYQQINAGYPCVLYITDPRGNEHYVTVYGYVNVTNPKKMTYKNLCIIDPIVRNGTQYFSGNNTKTSIKSLRKKPNGFYQVVVKQ